MRIIKCEILCGILYICDIIAVYDKEKLLTNLKIMLLQYILFRVKENTNVNFEKLLDWLGSFLGTLTTKMKSYILD